MSPVRATVLQLSLDLQLRTLQLSRYARSSKRNTVATASAAKVGGDGRRRRAVQKPHRTSMATYSFDAETSVATVTINDGKMNAFGFDMMSTVRYI